jgi:uncharacterized repeat protein (TIGR04076 family)
MRMANPAKVILKIESVQRKCKANPTVGKEFDLSKPISVGYSGDGEALCPTVFYAAFPNWRVLRHGGEIPDEKDRELSHISCPGGNVSIVLKRIKE